MIQIAIIIFLFVSCKGNTTQDEKAEAITHQTQLNQVKADSLLVNIQSKIYDAFIQSLISQNNTPLIKLSDELKKMYNTQKQNIILYWRSYLQFYSSIYYLKTGDRKTAEQEIDKGVNWVGGIKNKNSEDYALLAMIQGFSIQFKGVKAAWIAGEIKKNTQKAIALDSANLRGYYIYGNNDLYTPTQYGGGKKAEEYLLKAVSLPAQKIKNDYLPSWGKEEAYGVLVKFYIGKEKWELAKKYFQKGIAEYPKSYTLNQLASQLVGK